LTSTRVSARVDTNTHTHTNIHTHNLSLTHTVWRQLVEERGSELIPHAPPSSAWKGIYSSMHLQEARVRTNWNEGSCLRTSIPCNGNGIYCLQYDRETIICGSRDNTIKIWNSRSLVCEQVLQGHEGSVLCLQFDDKKIISGSSDSTVRVWDRATGRCVAVLANHTQVCACVCVCVLSHKTHTHTHKHSHNTLTHTHSLCCTCGLMTRAL
jgi:WD40 repeat protein